MRLAATLLTAVLAAGCGSQSGKPTGPGGHAHGDGGHSHGEKGHAGHDAEMTALEVLPGTGAPKAKEETTVRVRIPGASGEPVKAFDPVHDAKAHLIIVREGLDQFVHLHPEVDPATGVLSSRYTFPAGGTYHLFVDYRPSGKEQATATGVLSVSGEAPKALPLAPTAPGTVTAHGLTAKVTVSGVGQGKEGTIRFELSDAGKPVTDLEPYMGAMGHLVVMSADATRYVHAHPKEEKDAPNVVTFEAHFPAAGLYKGWGQFKRSGEVRLVPFVLEVK